ncbi:hypothetical protein EJB05_50662, partial [Eragrostis curvula]
MEVQATQPPSSSSTAGYPPWVMLEPDADVETTGSYSTADPKTLVVARTSTGHPLGVSLRLAAPPAESHVCIHFPQDAKPDKLSNEVIAAHGDSVLIMVAREKQHDYFIYNAGTTGSQQPPSLSLLPPCRRYLSKDSTGLLRRGEDELVVACLEMVKIKDETPTKHVAEVLRFRSGNWYIVRPPVIGLGNDIKDESLSYWSSRSVIPVGDDMLCWVSMHSGLIFSKVYDERLVLRYVPLPTDASCTEHFYSSRNVCVTGGDTVKFVNIFARCCCGDAGGSKCQHSHKAYLIKTWTLSMDSMTWVVDGMMDATELWALDSYKILPRVKVGFPVVSMDEPHIICFVVGDWLIMVDMRSKLLQSVYSYPTRPSEHRYPGKLFLPSKVSYYLNSKNPVINSQIEIEPQPVAILDNQLKYDASNSKLLPSGCNTSSEPEMHASEILAALQEISSYGLECDGTRKAISLLSQANGRRFKSYLGIPKKLRKDWLLMEINANKADAFI